MFYVVVKEYIFIRIFWLIRFSYGSLLVLKVICLLLACTLSRLSHSLTDSSKQIYAAFVFLQLHCFPVNFMLDELSSPSAIKFAIIVGDDDGS